jgi:hypothetical protein
MNRWKAASIHLSISLALATAIGALLYFLWFPPPYFVAAGANKLILVLMGVDIGIGPLLTLIVVNQHKSRKLLKLDLSVIAIVQTIAFAYGVHIIAAARPVFVVAAVDRFVLVSANELADADLAQGRQPAFRARSWTGPLLVGAIPPKGNEGMKIAEQAMTSGKDIDRQPRFYLPYDQVVDKLMHHAKPLSQLKSADGYQRKQIERIEAGANGEQLQMLPLQRGDHDYTAIVSPKGGRPLLILSIDPW